MAKNVAAKSVQDSTEKYLTATKSAIETYFQNKKELGKTERFCLTPARILSILLTKCWVNSSSSILLTVLRLGDDAYGAAILAEMASRTRRAVSRGSVYITLNRLVDKGLLVTTPAHPLRFGAAGPSAISS